MRYNVYYVKYYLIEPCSDAPHLSDSLEAANPAP